MRRPIDPGSEAAAVVADEEAVLDRVRHAISRRVADDGSEEGAPTALDYDRDLIALRDQIAEEKAEDVPSLVEQMTRVQALAAGRRARASLPIDVGTPYFAHLRLRSDRKGESVEQDILIGRHGLIDRAIGVQIVDWRDAPVSQIYYRYDEGDDYDEDVGTTTLRGLVLARRNVSIVNGRLRRIGCPQGTYVGSGDGRWFQLEGQGVALLGGGAGTAARPPRQIGAGPSSKRGQKGGRRFEAARPARSDSKQLPEIAALIDRHQFDLIASPTAGLVIIQGGAGSGKTTVALHRIAYLVFNDKRVKPSHCLFVVPSDALARYVAGVLPALGVNGVPVTTFRAWASTLRKRLVPGAPDHYADETPPAVCRLKKHAAMMPLLDAAVAAEGDAVRAHLAARLGDAAAPVVAAWDARAHKPPLVRLRAVKKRLGELGLSEAQSQTAELAIKQARGRLADVVRIVWEALTDRGRLEAALRAPGVHEPATTQEIDELVRWATAQLEEEEPAEYEGVDPERREAVDGKPLADGSDRAEEVAAGRLDREDDALLLYAYQRLHGELTRVDGQPLVYDHIAIDEAQDLAAIEVRVLYDALDDTRSLTIAGDVAQRVIFDNGFRGWEGLVADLRLPGGTAGVETLIRPLKLAYRSTAPVMRFARAVLGPLAATEDAEADAAARDGAPVELHELGGMGEAVAFVADALRSLLAREPSASVALLTRHAGQADAWAAALKRAEVPSLRRVRRQDFSFTPGVDVTDIGQVKGLEFDYVILLDVNDTSYPPTIESRHLLHIGATRATHQLWVVSTGRTSELVEALVREEEGGAAREGGEGSEATGG